MHSVTRSIIILAALGLTHATHAGGQSAPLLSNDVSIGRATGRGGEYADNDRGRNVLRVATHLRLLAIGPAMALLVADVERITRGGDCCPVALIYPGGEAVPNFPMFWGANIGLAARYRVGKVAVTGGGSIGWYRTTDGTADRRPDRASRAKGYGGDVAYRLVTHLSVIGGMRVVRVQNINDAPLRLVSGTLGLRIE
jgi:hypothetical protein